MKDLLGKALLDYHTGNYTEDLVTSTNISDDDILPLPYLFRDYSGMPKLEQKALRMCQGRVLDVGSGTGGHSLWLQEKGFNVKAIDTSPGAIKVAKYRGVLHSEVKPLLLETEYFDTILLLMNGTGIFQTLRDTPNYLNHLKSLLNPNGQILIDSSDIKYMYSSEIDIEGDIDLEELNQYNDGNYYGELDFHLSYRGEQELPMKWLYIDFKTLSTIANGLGLKCQKIMHGLHYDYLAQLELKNQIDK